MSMTLRLRRLLSALARRPFVEPKPDTDTSLSDGPCRMQASDLDIVLSEFEADPHEGESTDYDVRSLDHAIDPVRRTR